MTTDQQDAIVIERKVAAPPAKVYRFLTESVAWAKWQGVDATIEATPGGIFRMQMANGMLARGQFVDLVPDERVVFTWGWVDYPGCPPGSSTVEIDLITDDEGTLIRLVHRGLAPEERPIHTMGWNHHADRLALIVDGGDPGPDPGPG
jgi:uncharacterized protein YndB with AHSA1/START domain